MEVERLFGVCLLCLESKKDFVDTIAIDSIQSKEVNIKHFLLKYLWPMNHIGTTSWICTTCWSQLHEFHKFYERIEQVHRVCGLITENVKAERNDADIEEFAIKEIVESPIDELEKYIDDELEKNCVKSEEECNFFFDKYDMTYSDLQTELKVERIHNKINDPENCKKDDVKISDGENVSQLNKRENLTLNYVSGIPIKETDIVEKMDNEEMKQIKLLSASKKHHLSLDKNNDCNNDTDLEFLSDDGQKSTHYTPKRQNNEMDKFLAENFEITCYICDIPLKTFFLMSKHFEVHHTETGHVKCCNKKFYRRSTLVDHVKYHLNPNYYKCTQCGKVMTSRRYFAAHMESHEDDCEKKHCCNICGRKFTNKTVLNKHKRAIHLS